MLVASRPTCETKTGPVSPTTVAVMVKVAQIVAMIALCAAFGFAGAVAGLVVFRDDFKGEPGAVGSQGEPGELGSPLRAPQSRRSIRSDLGTPRVVKGV